jgi:nucleoid DNA-binding protein
MHWLLRLIRLPFRLEHMAKTSEAAVDIKDDIIRKLHLSLGIPIKHIRAVIDNQFKTANAAMKEHTSIEVTGFGRFTLVEGRVRKRKECYVDKIAKDELYLQEHPDLDKTERSKIEKKISTLNFFMDDLKKKEDAFEAKRNSRGMEK